MALRAEPAPRPLALELELDRRQTPRQAALPLGDPEGTAPRPLARVDLAPAPDAFEEAVEIERGEPTDPFAAPLDPPPPAPAPTPDARAVLELSCAPLERRLAAWGIDGALAALFAAVPLSLALRRAPGLSELVSVILPAGLGLACLAAFSHAALGHALMGATLGQHVMGLRVAGPDGGAPGLGRSALRAALAVAGAALLGLGLLPALLTSRGRGLHDLAAGTVVVRAA